MPPSTTHFDTLCVHAGQSPDPSTGAVVTPIVQTSTYAQATLGEHRGFEYSRAANPTRSALEAHLAILEGGRAGFAFASGMAATTAIVTRLVPGDHLVATTQIYGGSYRLFEEILRPHGVAITYADCADLTALDRAITPATRIVFLETPANPLLDLIDIAAAAEIAHRHGATVVVDNTFASPCLQRPLALGADLVMHSTTKYLNGHSDSIGGAVIATRDDDIAWLRFVQTSAGAILGPFDSWLVLRGTKTLALRMAKHSANGQAVAEFLDTQPGIARVHYPGLGSHPQHALARRQMPDGFGGMLAFDVGSGEAARRVMNRLRLITIAESLGGVESLASCPATMSHASVPADVRTAMGVTDGLIRLSAGIEDASDLVDDLRQALH